MRLIKPSQLVFLLASVAFSNAYADDAAKTKAESSVMTKSTMATVNGVAIPQSRYDMILKDVLAQGQPDSPELKAQIRESLINREILAQEASKKGTDKSPEFLSKLEVTRQQVLIDVFIHNYITAHPISEADAKKEFEKLSASMGDKEYKVRHILVKDEAEAKDIIAKIRSGKKFEKFVSKSMDPGSKANGGDLGWAPASNYVKPFAEAVAKLKKGELTEAPVQTQFGWHVIKLEDVRPLKAPPFEQIKANLMQRMQQQAVQKLIADLRSAAKVE